MSSCWPSKAEANIISDYYPQIKLDTYGVRLGTDAKTDDLSRIEPGHAQPSNTEKREEDEKEDRRHDLCSRVIY